MVAAENCCGNLSRAPLPKAFAPVNGVLLCCVDLNCNITATRTATQPRNAVIYRVNLPCSMFKGFEPLRKRPCLGKVKNADCVVKNSVAWLCCSSCCSYVAVVLQLKPTQHSKEQFSWRRALEVAAVPH